MADDSGERRSGFLVFAAFVASAYLVAFGADAILSLADELQRSSGAAAMFTDLRQLVAYFVVFASFPVLLLIIFVPHLPKLVLLPPILFSLWAAFGAPGFASMADEQTMRSDWMTLSMIQVGLAAIVLLLNKLRTGTWLIHAAGLPYKHHLVLRTILALVAVALFLPVLFAGMMVFAVTALVQEETGGYLKFTWNGIDVQETTLTRDGTTIRLVGMAHIGDPAFYKELYASIPANALVLAEGVTDKNRLLKGFSYTGVASALGLGVQPHFDPDEVDVETVTEEPAQSSRTDKRRTMEKAPEPAKPRSKPLVVYADADVSDFAPLTLRFLQDTGEIYTSKSFSEAMERFSKINERYDEKDIKAVFDDLLYKRNNRLLAELDKRLDTESTIVIPWGAQHMPDLEAALIDRGFKVQSRATRQVASYRTIWEGLRARRAAPATQSGVCLYRDAIT